MALTREQTSRIVAQPLPWLERARMPPAPAAAIAAMAFTDDQRRRGLAALAALSELEWKAVFAFAEQAGFVLVLGTACRDSLPAWARDRIDRAIARNTERLARLRAELGAVSARLEAARIDYVLLKGFSLGPEYTIDPRLRMHYDMDLFMPKESVRSAYEAVLALGYEPLPSNDQVPSDHLPPLTRKTGWRWQGDPFDPEIPPSVELHFQLWDEEAERLPAPGVEQFLERRRNLGGIPVLHPADRLAYSALHLLRHLFRGSARVSHVYEIARFLDTQQSNEAFWLEWRELHSEPLRRLQAVAFRLAVEWFGCHVAPEPAGEMERLPQDVRLWFEKHAASPAESLFHPNKNELWLHLALVDSAQARRAIVFRKLFPRTVPPPFVDVFLPAGEISFRMRWSQRWAHAVYLARRSAYHARTLPAMLWHGALWKTRSSGLDAPFWWFTLAGAIYALGFFVFYLLYNLFLLDRGYREDALGLIAGSLTLGSIAGVLPAASFVRRAGIGPALRIASLGIPAAFALRCMFSGEPALVVFAFIAGATSSVWAVAYSPAVAALTTERSRPVGFSITNSSGIGVGMLAGLIGGRIPGWILRARVVHDAVHAKQAALLASAAFAALAIWPLTKLRLGSAEAREKHQYPRSAFIFRFLSAIGVWSLATGAFNPLFNAYFERRFHLSLESIGMVFGLSHMGQVATVLLSPLVFRRLGLVRGVACMQLTTGLVLGSMAASPTAYVAAALYVAYMSFQFMGDPGTSSLLMNSVKPAQRSGAAALFFLAAYLTQAVAATASGAVVARYGYPPMLAAASVLAVLAAFLFWRLPEESR